MPHVFLFPLLVLALTKADGYAHYSMFALNSRGLGIFFVIPDELGCMQSK